MTDFAFRDRMAGIPVRDGPGARDRPWPAFSQPGAGVSPGQANSGAEAPPDPASRAECSSPKVLKEREAADPGWVGQDL